MQLRNILLLIVFVVVSSCSGISMITKGGGGEDLYRPEFTKKITEIKQLYQLGESDKALAELQLFNEQEMLPSEKALRRNLIGVIQFSKEKYEQAIYNFELAVTNSRLDENLTAQLYLNLSSSYYKLNYLEKSYEMIEKGNGEALKDEERKKYYRLRYVLAKELNKDLDATRSIILYLKNKKSISDLKSDQFFESLLSRFFSLDDREKLNLLEDFVDDKPIVVGYLAYLESEKLYYKGQKDDATDLLEWVDKYYEQNEEVRGLVRNFLFRLENYAKMNSRSIGVVLPLSGRKANFGKRALLGIDSALKEINSKLAPEKKYKLIIKDSEASGAVGAYRVRDLIENHYVSMVIGGLFSSEATKEYLETRRYGVFFMSLAQIYLPKEQKDHLLLEIPGSVESQINELFTKNIYETFGKRAAIVYPRSDRGEAYLNEFWRKAKLEGVEVNGVLSFDEKNNDFRGPIKNLLGLKFGRERQEEYDLLQEIYSLEKSRSIRRVQTLKPQIDFDWVFIPSLPKETLQIVPSFSYFDAFRLNIIGVPSWRSRALTRESRKLGSLYFIGDDVASRSTNYAKSFVKEYKKRPRVVELRSYDALKIVSTLLDNKDYQSRDQLDMDIRSKQKVSGLTGDWTFSDGIWLKEMNTLKLSRGKINTIF